MEVKVGITAGPDYDFAASGQTRAQNTESEQQKSQLPVQPEIKASVDNQDLLKATEEMTQWMQSWNTDIQFAIHEGTNQLMVQVIDTKKQLVLKEFPSHEFLDTIAKISEYVGVLLDKKI